MRNAWPRAAKSMTTPSASSRRAANASAPADASSSQCTSSITHRSGPSSLRGSEEAQRRGADVEPARALCLGERQRAAQRIRLDRRQLRQPVEQGSQELVQARVRELRLGLDAERAHDLGIAGLRDGVLEQRALADPGVAADDERAAPAAPRLLEHPIDPSALALTADEHVAIIERHVCNQECARRVG